MQVLAMNGIQEATEIIAFDPVVQAGEGDASVSVAVGLEAAIIQAYEQGKLPAELGFPWAKAGRTLSLDDYVSFPSAR